MQEYVWNQKIILPIPQAMSQLDKPFSVKACVCYFKFFYQMIALNYEKCFLSHLMSSAHFWDLHIFVLPSSPFFFLVRHCIKGWLKINLKVYDVINCLNKNLITLLVWYLEKEKRYGIEQTLSIDRVLNKEHFHGKIIQKRYTKS